MKTYWIVTKNTVHQHTYNEKSDIPEGNTKPYYEIKESKDSLQIYYWYYFDSIGKYNRVNQWVFKKDWYTTLRSALEALIRYKQKELEKISQRIFDLTIQLEHEKSSSYENSDSSMLKGDSNESLKSEA